MRCTKRLKNFENEKNEKMFKNQNPKEVVVIILISQDIFEEERKKRTD